MKSKTSKIITSENKAAKMFDYHGKRSKVFNMQKSEPSFQFPHSSPIPLKINNPQLNCCLGNMANILHLMGDLEQTKLTVSMVTFVIV